MIPDFCKKSKALSKRFTKIWFINPNQTKLNIKKLLKKTFHLCSIPLSSLKNMFHIYYNSFGILKVYFFGGATQTCLHDSNGGKLSLEVSKENVKKIISLSNLLAKFKDKYEVQSNEINFKLWPNVFKSYKPPFTGITFYYL